MIGHVDITKDGRPVGRATLDTDKGEMVVLVLQSVSEDMFQAVVETFVNGGAPDGATVRFERIDDDHFFDLFMKGDE